MSSFLSHFWRTVLPDVGVLIDSFLHFASWRYQATALWPPWFLARSLLRTSGSPCVWWIASPWLLSRFSLSLFFNGLIIMCLGVVLLEFVLVKLTELHGCSHSCLSPNLGSFQPLFLPIFSLPLSLILLHMELPQWVCWSTLWCPTGPSFFFLSVPQTQ